MDKKEIIDRIGIIRNRVNLSARALSLLAGLNAGYINRLESKKDFLPSLEAFLDILEVCNVTPEEFFYNNFSDYSQDKEIIDLLKTTSIEKKEIVLSILRLNKWHLTILITQT